MNKQTFYFLLLITLLSTSYSIAQKSEDKPKQKLSRLFRTQSNLPLKMSYSNIELRKKTNESKYLKSAISYKDKEEWKNLDVELTARGNFRRGRCYFVPVKLKIKKANSKGTLFKGQKKLKLVVPCLNSKDMNDNVLKEFIAYKIYEKISKYNFSTRLIDLSLSEIRGKKTKEHTLKGFLIEDDKEIADRFNAKIIDRSIHPLKQDNITSIQNAFFQYMIGNVDFSIAKLHNAKLFYIEKKIIPVPYDFDMNGFVDPSYENVSERPANSFLINKVTQRKFRGFKRDVKLFEQVRQEFLKNKKTFIAIVEGFENQFDNKSEYDKAKKYLLDFFKIIENDKSFQKEILDEMR